MSVELSYCVVNTNGRAHLLRCLEAIRDTHPAGLAHEILVLDNRSDDGSAAAVRAWLDGPGGGQPVRLIERVRRAGKAENDSSLIEAAGAPLCLLLNEDSELLPGAAAALVAALASDERAAVAGAQLISPQGEPQPCAWRLPTLGTAIAGAVFLHRLLTVQAGRGETREVGWVQSSAMLVRRRAALEVGLLDAGFFVYSDETDFEKRLRDAGWRILLVPKARAIHHEQLATDRRAGSRRVVEFHRGRDRYMRKHHPRAAPFARPLAAFPYLLRSIAARALPGHDPAWYRLHARQAMWPARGGGLREAAAELNREADRG